MIAIRIVEIERGYERTVFAVVHWATKGIIGRRQISLGLYESFAAEANADARPLTTADACRAELVDHLTTGVDWVGAIEAMRARGVTTFIEIGPGQVLTGLIKRIAPDAVAIATDDKAASDRLALPFADAAAVDG